MAIPSKLDYIEFAGSFRYASQFDLDRALCAAQACLEDDELGDLDRLWLQWLSRRGTVVRVAAVLPPTIDRYVAAAVVGSLAEHAIEGVVDVTCGCHLVDAFCAEA